MRTDAPSPDPSPARIGAVAIGQRGEHGVEITGGLKPGERIVVDHVLGIENGQALTAAAKDDDKKADDKQPDGKKLETPKPDRQDADHKTPDDKQPDDKQPDDRSGKPRSYAPSGSRIGAGAELQRPLAVAVIGGLTLATVVTLVVTPGLTALVAKNRVTP